MVALRQTHNAKFDFHSWTAALNLPESERELLHRTFEAAETSCPDEPSRERFTRLCAEIVEILAGLNMDLLTLQCGILYLPFDDGHLKGEDITADFGAEALELLEGVRDMEAIKFLQNVRLDQTTEYKVDKVRRMLLAMVRDVRAVVIKLAERIAIIREAKHAPEAKKTMIAREVANIYAPLANRLGIGQLKWELEDLAFRFLHPDEYQEIARDLGERRVERERYVEQFVAEIADLIRGQGINCEVYGRPKHIYSIWRKMQRKHLPFTELYDVRAVRVLVDKIPDCYAVLGIVHARFSHVKREFDDYIVNPKPNGYQSLHTVVYGDGGKLVEVQIRTRHMHETAELGVAAHWKYKEGGSQGTGAEQRINWLRKLLAWRDDMVESGALRDEYRTQVFEDRIYVFTPRGEVIDLPTGATPLDFAYHVHTMVGHRCIGAKVDGRIVPFTTALRTGQTVEIITQREPNPSRDWMNPDMGFLKTAKARSKVQVFFRRRDFEQNLAAGAEILNRELLHRGLNLTREQVMAALADKVTRFNVKSTDDILAGLGAGDVTLNQIFGKLGKEFLEGPEDPNALSREAESRMQKAKQLDKSPGRGAVIVDGVGDLMTHMARCCKPIPGDDIQGFITQGRGISVHRADCPELADLCRQHPERLIRVEWGSSARGNYEASVRIVGNDYAGFLRDVTTLTANEHVNVLGVRSRTDRSTDTAIIDISMLIADAGLLQSIMAKFKALRNVREVTRL